jgi:hypothetical protein
MPLYPMLQNSRDAKASLKPNAQGIAVERQTV